MHLSNTQILNSGKICKHKIVLTTSNTNKVLLHNTLLRKVNDKKKYKLQSLILSPSPSTPLCLSFPLSPFGLVGMFRTFLITFVTRH